jgi:BTB/POZ domain-containing protein KCTD9
MIYQGSEHNFRASAFHQYCDNKGPTLSIVKSDKNRTFGGFTMQNWNQAQHGNYVHDNQAFLIQLDERVKLK